VARRPSDLTPAAVDASAGLGDKPMFLSRTAHACLLFSALVLVSLDLHRPRRSTSLSDTWGHRLQGPHVRHPPYHSSSHGMLTCGLALFYSGNLWRRGAVWSDAAAGEREPGRSSRVTTFQPRARCMPRRRRRRRPIRRRDEATSHRAGRASPPSTSFSCSFNACRAKGARRPLARLIRPRSLTPLGAS